MIRLSAKEDCFFILIRNGRRKVGKKNREGHEDRGKEEIKEGDKQTKKDRNWHG